MDSELLLIILHAIYLSELLVLFMASISGRLGVSGIPIALMVAMRSVVIFSAVIYAVALGRYHELTFGFGLEIWNYGTLLEIVFFGAFMFGVFVLSSYDCPVIGLGTLLSHGDTYSWYFLVFVVVVSAMIATFFGGEWITQGYNLANVHVVRDLADRSITVGGIQRFFTNGILTPALIVVVFSSDRPRGLVSTGVMIVAVLLFGVPLGLRTLLSGARGQFASLAMAISVVWFVGGRWKHSLVLLLVGFLTLVVFSGGIRVFRVSESSLTVVDDDWLPRVSMLVQASRESLSERDLDYAIDSTINRMDLNQGGGLLALDTAHDNSFVGLQPYIGSVLALIPRYFWSNKPIPRSATTSYRGTPAYIVGELRGGYNSNASVTVSGISYWQFSWPGVIVAGLVNGVLLSWIACKTLKSGLIGLFFFLVVAFEFNFLMVASIDQWLLIFSKYMPILFVLLVTYSIAVKLFASAYHRKRHQRFVSVRAITVESEYASYINSNTNI